jgi:glutamine amidotransferase
MGRIAVIDYGMGNLHSVQRALQHVASGARVTITREPAELASADRVVFPGQGAIGACRQELEAQGLLDAVARAAREKPFLGMCLGPQMMMDFSEENGGVQGLGVFPGRVVRFAEGLRDRDTGYALKVPHMGWNRVRQSLRHPLWSGIEQDAWFYFVHSYYLCPEQAADVAGTTDYGLRFASALARDNVFAVQFHPEKSARDGLRLLANFVTWSPA